MKFSTLLAAAIVTVAAIPASAATFTVDAKDNTVYSGQLATGLTFAAGDTFTVTTAADDLWSMDYRLPYKDANANGNTAYWAFEHGGLTAWIGTLVGRIGSSYFALGTDVTVTAAEAGELYLFAWDSNIGDNAGSIAVNVETPAAVPLPATALLLLGGLGGIATLRRKRTA